MKYLRHNMYKGNMLKLYLYSKRTVRITSILISWTRWRTSKMNVGMILKALRLAFQQLAILGVASIDKPITTIGILALRLAIQSTICLEFTQFDSIVVLDTRMNTTSGSHDIFWSINKVSVSILTHFRPNIDKISQPGIQILSIFLNSPIDMFAITFSIIVDSFSYISLLWAISRSRDFTSIVPTPSVGSFFHLLKSSENQKSI